jgi:hypothetical protein
VRVRAEAILVEMLPDMRLGDRIALARLATPAVLRLLLADADRKVSHACLLNPRLREADLVVALQGAPAPSLVEEVAASSRWSESYAVRLALVMQPRTPLALCLAQLSSLLRRDLLRVAETAGLAPLVRAAARRLALAP